MDRITVRLKTKTKMKTVIIQNRNTTVTMYWGVKRRVSKKLIDILIILGRYVHATLKMVCNVMAEEKISLKFMELYHFSDIYEALPKWFPLPHNSVQLKASSLCRSDWSTGKLGLHTKLYVSVFYNYPPVPMKINENLMKMLFISITKESTIIVNENNFLPFSFQHFCSFGFGVLLRVSLYPIKRMHNNMSTSSIKHGCRLSSE